MSGASNRVWPTSCQPREVRCKSTTCSSRKSSAKLGFIEGIVRLSSGRPLPARSGLPLHDLCRVEKETASLGHFSARRIWIDGPGTGQASAEPELFFRAAKDGGTACEQAYKSVPFYLSSRGYGVLVNEAVATLAGTFAVGDTVRVRLRFPNPQLKLKPEMFSQVQIKSPLTKEVVVVPTEAVLDTGLKQHHLGPHRAVRKHHRCHPA